MGLLRRSSRGGSVAFSTLLHVVQWHCLSTSVCEARQNLCIYRLPFVEALTFDRQVMLELRSASHCGSDPLPYFRSLHLSPAPLSGVPTQPPPFAPTSCRPPGTGSPNAAALREAPCRSPDALI